MSFTYRFMRFKDGKPKALTLSYDDGIEQDIRLVSILDKYGLKCTFNVSAGCLCDKKEIYPKEQILGRFLTKSQAVELYKNSGHEVAIHGYKHPYLDQLATNYAMYEIIKDRKELEKLFGTMIRGCAYPFGKYNDDVVRILELAQIKYARTVENTFTFDIPTDWLRLKPTCRHLSGNFMELTEKFIELNSMKPSLFYVWGHSFEFERDNNWDLIENFGQRIGNRDDIWYATNIEIYDYVEAYKNLQFSANGKKAYNPSVIDVWIFSNDEVYKIPAGETVEL